jgi:hypothetical protein
MIELKKETKKWYKTWYGITGIIIIGLFILTNIGGTDKTPTTPTQETPKQDSKPKISKEQAQKELDAVMSVGKEAKIVLSYEFSDTATEVYIDKDWYKQTVQFKKDFIGRVGFLKEAVTGYSHFVVKDGYTNEKVGEIKAFSQSIEVYK